MLSETSVTSPPTSSQPSVMAAGPPLTIARKYEVRQPASTEMMEKDTAKLEKPDSRRCSSWL